jgi:hypothetical protein
MSVKAYFSGVESGQHWQHCVDAKVKHVLMSYWQFRDKNPNIIRDRKKQYPHINFMVDSGAHTFITAWRKFTHWTRKDFDDYVAEYADWIKRNGKYVTAVVECDLDFTLNEILAQNRASNLGPQIVQSWQQKHFMPLQKMGIDVIYVWHEERKMEGWEQMCSQFDYVGLPGYMSSEPDFNKYISIARRYSTRIHGFAATKQIDFRDVPWYSIDSITWKSPEMWGVMLVWDERNQKFISEGDKSKRYKYADIIRRAGFDADKICKDADYKLGTKFGLYSMRQMEAFYEKKYQDRIFYYELRMPHRDVIAQVDKPQVREWWKLFRPDVLFKDFANSKTSQIRQILSAISAVQNGDVAYLTATPFAMDFMGKVFPKLVNPLVSDIKILQQELANYTSPPNPPPLARTEDFHYQPSGIMPKTRDDEVYNIADLEFQPAHEHYLARLL